MRTRHKGNPSTFTLFATALVAALFLASITGCSGESEQTPTPPANEQDELADRLERIEEALAQIQAEMEAEKEPPPRSHKDGIHKQEPALQHRPRQWQIPRDRLNQTQPRRSPYRGPASADEVPRSRRRYWKGWAPPCAKPRPSPNSSGLPGNSEWK